MVKYSEYNGNIENLMISNSLYRLLERCKKTIDHNNIDENNKIKDNVVDHMSKNNLVIAFGKMYDLVKDTLVDRSRYRKLLAVEEFLPDSYFPIIIYNSVEEYKEGVKNFIEKEPTIELLSNVGVDKLYYNIGYNRNRLTGRITEFDLDIDDISVIFELNNQGRLIIHIYIPTVEIISDLIEKGFDLDNHLVIIYNNIKLAKDESSRVSIFGYCSNDPWVVKLGNVIMAEPTHYKLSVVETKLREDIEEDDELPTTLKDRFKKLLGMGN